MRQEEERKIATLRRDKKSILLDAANDNIDKDDARHADSTSTSTSSRQQQQDSNADKNSNSSEEDDDEDDDEEEDEDEDDEDKQHRKDVVDNAVRAQFEDAEDIR